MRQELAPVLENVAFNLGYLAATADLLWQLARTDTRKTNQFPDHPIRVLQRLIAYAPTTPLVYQENLLTVVSAWLDEPDPGDLLYSPFDVLEELLATEAVVQTPGGLSLTIRSFPVAPDAVGDLRSRVMELAFAQLKSPHLRPAVRAAEALGKSLAYPMPVYNRTPDEDERDRWTPMFVDTITRISCAAAKSQLDPAVVIALQAALLWHYQHSPTATRTAARQVWRVLPERNCQDLWMEGAAPSGYLVVFPPSVSARSRLISATRRGMSWRAWAMKSRSAAGTRTELAPR